MCYMDTNSLIYNIESIDFYKDIAGDVQYGFNMSGYSQNHSPPIGVNKQVTGFMN